jgi:6-phosphogluconolactonase
MLQIRLYIGMKISRHSVHCFAFLAASLIITLTSVTASAEAKGKYLFYVGTYTKEEGSQSKGIYAYRYDVATGESAALGLAAETTNPSWLAIHPNGRFLYAVNELGDYKGPNSGGVSAFSIDRDEKGRPTGKLTFLNEVRSRGADPCYVTVDKTGKWVLVANYSGGSVAVFPVQADGKLGEASSFVQHTGHGSDPKRQEGPHAHSINLAPTNRFAFVDDLGLDELLLYQFDSNKGTLTPNNPPFAKVDPAAGPRHFALHPSGKFAYAISEMQGSVTAFSTDLAAGTLHRLQTISTLPKDFKGAIEDAEIEVHPSGKFLYASNRGDGNSIAVFAIDPSKGMLTLVEYASTQGKTPRSFEIDPTGRFLLAANEKSNNIVVFRIDATTGRLTPTGPVLEVSEPVCVKFLKVE